jgi:hypothetical protein
MPPEPYDVPGLRRFAGDRVRVRLADGSTWTGRLRTELLTELSVAVYLGGRRGEGVTVYIDQIAEIVRLPVSAE